MATSGVVANQLTRNQVIDAALRTLGVLALDQTTTSTEYSNALIKLNAMLGEFRALGVPLWARTSYTITLVNGTSTYNIGSSQTLNTPYPIHLLQAYRTDQGTTKVPMEIDSDYNYNLYPGGSSGTPIRLTYQPKVNLGTIKMWPTPDSNAATNSTVTIVYQRPMEYMSGATDTFDVPEEWLSAIIYNLAVRMAPEYGIPLQDRQLLMKEAKEYLDRALENGTEDASFFFQVDRRG